MIVRKKATVLKRAATLALSLSPTSNVPTTQSYDEASGAYLPDRTLMPLVLNPKVYSDGEDAEGDVTSKRWCVVSYDSAGLESEQVVTSGASGLELYPEGYPLGLKVTRNVSAGDVLILRFHVKARGVEAMAEVSLRTESIPAPTPDLELDYPAVSAWNPLVKGSDKVTVRPLVRAYGQTGLSVAWVKHDGSGWRDIDPSDPADAELELDAATQALTIDRRWMGERVSVACRLMKGDKILRERPVTIRRRVPDFVADFRVCPLAGPEDSGVLAEAEIRQCPGGLLSDPETELRIIWLDGAGRSVGEGISHLYPIGPGETEVEAQMGVEDRGPLRLFTIGGAYLTVGGVLIGGR